MNRPQLDRPFGVPLPREVVLNLPVPPSVNRTRKVNWAASSEIRAWKNRADALVISARIPKPWKIAGRFEVFITFSEDHTGIDLDNGIKAVIDYLRRIEIIEDDSPKHLRRLVVQWGHAAHGCRVLVRAA